jgi:predicted nucleotidyltransferase
VTGEGPFEEALAGLASIFEERGIPYALIGGLAAAVWGAPRATEDIDVLADVTPSPELDAAFRASGFEAEWRRGTVDDPVPLLLRLRSATGPDVEVLCATRPWEREMLARSARVRIPEGRETRVIAIEDLIVLKLLPEDREIWRTSPTSSSAPPDPFPTWRGARRSAGCSSCCGRCAGRSEGDPRGAA